MRNLAACRFTRHWLSLKPFCGFGSSPTFSGPMKKSSGLLPACAMPIAGWILKVVAIFYYLSVEYLEGSGGAAHRSMWVTANGRRLRHGWQLRNIFAEPRFRGNGGHGRNYTVMI